MILPDVNVLVAAFHRDADGHEQYATWLTTTLSGGGGLALVDVVLTGMVRIVTHPRIFADPAPATEAVEFVTAIRRAPASVSLPSADATWSSFGELVAVDRHIRGNLVPDAWLASLAIANGCTLATADRGFARFEGLDWFDPTRT